MRTKLWLSAIVVGILWSAAAQSAQNAVIPRLSAVEPMTGKKGDVVTATGVNCQKANLTQLFLTTGTEDVKTEITEQTDTTVKFKIPEIKAGRYTLMVLTGGTNARLVEQPVKITVE